MQFIGGEPTLHPHFTELVEHALDRGVEVEVYSNLVKVAPGMWELFSRPGVRLATSYYSTDARAHDAVTRRPRSHQLTLANIHEARRRTIPLRVGIIGVHEAQNVTGAVAELRDIGIADVGVDHLREIGRGVRETGPSVDQLCGHCASGKLAVMPDGTAHPCVFSRWLPVGDARIMSLVDIDSNARTIRAELATAFAARTAHRPCGPDCAPTTTCKPKVGDGDPHGCGPDYQPCSLWQNR